MKLVTFAEYARMAGVKRQTVYRWSSGKLAAYVVIQDGVKLLDIDAMALEGVTEAVTDTVTSDTETVTEAVACDTGAVTDDTEAVTEAVTSDTRHVTSDTEAVTIEAIKLLTRQLEEAHRTSNELREFYQNQLAKMEEQLATKDRQIEALQKALHAEQCNVNQAQSLSLPKPKKGLLGLLRSWTAHNDDEK